MKSRLRGRSGCSRVPRRVCLNVSLPNPTARSRARSAPRPAVAIVEFYLDPNPSRFSAIRSAPRPKPEFGCTARSGRLLRVRCIRHRLPLRPQLALQFGSRVKSETVVSAARLPRELRSALISKERRKTGMQFETSVCRRFFLHS